MKERVYAFGSHGGLVGVITEPAPEQLRPGAPAILMSNVGLNHRTGPGRMWVDLARRMSQHGFVSLRFDMSGLGDSAIRRDSRSDLERNASDLREAIDFVLQKKKLSQAALIGLCSGVDPVHTVATDDARVAAAVFLDGYSYPTKRHLVQSTIGKFLDKERYLRVLRRRALKSEAVRETGDRYDIFSRDYPAPEAMRANLDAMLARGARLMFGYTGGVSYSYSYADQLFEMLPGPSLRGRVQVEMFPQSDHLFTLQRDRDDLFARLERFLLTKP